MAWDYHFFVAAQWFDTYFLQERLPYIFPPCKEYGSEYTLFHISVALRVFSH